MRFRVFGGLNHQNRVFGSSMRQNEGITVLCPRSWVEVPQHSLCKWYGSHLRSGHGKGEHSTGWSARAAGAFRSVCMLLLAPEIECG